MKNPRTISLFLCLVLILGCFARPACAVDLSNLETVAVTEETAPAESTAAQNPQAGTNTTLINSAAKLPFGQASIKQGCRTIEGMMPLAGSERRLATAQSVFAYEMNSDTVIYSYNPDTKLSTGTLSKIVTALVAIENTKLNDVVTCSPGIQSKVPGSSIKVNLKSEEQMTVEDLLHCLLLHSANDAAVALAEHVAGTTNAYVELMNQRVKKMGCTNTEFGNISGLDTAVSFTTARDMAKIMTEACNNETFIRISGTAQYTVPATNMEEERKLTTTNYMIDNHIIPQFLDDRVKAGLASHTEGSGSSIAVMSEYNKMKIVVVVMGALRTYNAEQTWKVESYGNFNEAQELLDYIYTGFKVNRVLYSGQALNQFSVIGGESDVVGQPYVSFDSVLPANCSMDNLYMEYTAVKGGYTAPIKKGDMIATVAVKYRNSYVAEAEIYAMNDVVSVEDSKVTIRSTAVKTDSSMEGVKGFFGTMVVLLAAFFGLYVLYGFYRRARLRAQRRRRRASRRRSY